MNDVTVSSFSPHSNLFQFAGFLERVWLRCFMNLLNKLEYGYICVILPNKKAVYFQGRRKTDQKATLVLNSTKPIKALFLKGEIAFAECFIYGHWSSPNLTALFNIMLENENAFMTQKAGSFLIKSFQRLQHFSRRNSRKKARKNISFHYDLGNNFYEKWLDKTMTYSSALFTDKAECLQTAQLNKFRQITQMAGLKQDDSVLEIGCGWGGFSEFAVKELSCNMHGITLSKEQLEYAEARYTQGGYNNKASVSLTDYRDITGHYDKIVSIEMFEAVGHQYWPLYFSRIHELLKPNGIAVLQIITIEEKRFEQYKKSVDFIQKYIFPGGCLPSDTVLSTYIKNQGLVLEDKLNFGHSYARTCNMWLQNFINNWEYIKSLGFDEQFKRMWIYYLSYCEAGFEKGSIDVGLFKIRKMA